MPTDTVYITILRETANLFESTFSFFSDFPFPEWMPDYRSPSSLEKFLESPRKYYNKSTPWYFVAKNYQAFDLGEVLTIFQITVFYYVMLSIFLLGTTKI